MTRAVFALSLCALLLAGCPDGGIQNRAVPANTEETKDPQILALRKAIKDVAERPEQEVEMIEVQHILISFQGANPQIKATRSRDEAEKLTAGLLAKIQAGTDFSALMAEHSEDPGPGVYGMSKSKSRQDPANNIVPRSNMVPAFSNVGWRLKVGEVGVAPYHGNDSPFGWHIIKRLK
ncbi:MAG: peptidylprolyl isomerase [Planctomycetes bacterium]|nr:peptidylprolyl isomerase [Planctomycetota bacterium]